MVATLPNGQRIRYVSRPDVRFLYHEIFQRRVYAQHGQTLPSGGTVLDIGANIGISTLFFAESVGLQGTVIAVEPLPPIFEVLQHNIHAHAAHLAAAGRPPAAIPQLVNCGLGDGSTQMAHFTLYKRAAGAQLFLSFSVNQMQCCHRLGSRRAPCIHASMHPIRPCLG